MKLLTIALALLMFTTAVPAVEPPELINYQGVLRDASGDALEGPHDMWFHFYDDETAGARLLTDLHVAVAVTGGLFNVHLGGGSITSGTVDRLAEVFADRSEVWMQIEIAAPPNPLEVLIPRVRVVGAAYALNADHLDGRDSSGYLDTSSTPQGKAGPLIVDSLSIDDWGIRTRMGLGGGWFADADDSGYAYVGHGDRGIEAHGNEMGGWFMDADGSGYAQVGFGDRGIDARGNEMGGYFKDADGSGYAYVGYDDFGIWASGSQVAGVFEGPSCSASLGYYGTGIVATGAAQGAFFKNNTGSGSARVGYEDYGIYAWADVAAGYFDGANDSEGYIAYNDRGVWASGSYAGATFGDTIPATNIWADIATHHGGTYHNIRGNGQKDFIQNHPEDPGAVLNYTALEGDETAVYTRGIARLVDGEARVQLGETFRWVTNPDIGLTVYLTPVGEWSDLYVVEKSTEEIVVGSAGGASDVAFDYLVVGLRIGFEQASRVGPKDREAPIPSAETASKFYSEHPDLERFNSLARFKLMQADVTGVSLDEIDLSGAAVLHEAITASAWQRIGQGEPDRPVTGESAVRHASEDAPASTAERELPPARLETARVAVEAPIEQVPEPATSHALFPVAAAVEVGEVLTLDSERPGFLRPATFAADPAVVGIAAGEPIEKDGVMQVPVVSSSFAEVRVDPSYGAIRAGDLLVASPTPGHAMLSLAPTPGTVVGKALEPLDTDTGRIKVLVMLR